jgi:hypothetical protein
MKKFDYMVISGIETLGNNELKHFGSYGWELISVVYADGLFYSYFKREV